MNNRVEKLKEIFKLMEGLEGLQGLAKVEYAKDIRSAIDSMNSECNTSHTYEELAKIHQGGQENINKFLIDVFFNSDAQRLFMKNPDFMYHHPTYAEALEDDQAATRALNYIKSIDLTKITALTGGELEFLKEAIQILTQISVKAVQLLSNGGVPSAESNFQALKMTMSLQTLNMAIMFTGLHSEGLDITLDAFAETIVTKSGALNKLEAQEAKYFNELYKAFGLGKFVEGTNSNNETLLIKCIVIEQLLLAKPETLPESLRGQIDKIRTNTDKFDKSSRWWTSKSRHQRNNQKDISQIGTAENNQKATTLLKGFINNGSALRQTVQTPGVMTQIVDEEFSKAMESGIFNGSKSLPVNGSESLPVTVGRRMVRPA